MTDQGRRFCPRCGTGLVAGMPFCPSCGLNTADAGGSASPAPTATDPADRAVDALGRRVDSGTPTPAPAPAPRAPATGAQTRKGYGVSSSVLGRLADPASRGTSIVVAAVIVAAGLVAFGLLMRPQPSTNPGTATDPQGSPTGTDGVGGPGASPVGAPPLIVGVTIQSPADGQVVATKDVTVIGLAPPGLTVTRDVSFGLDQHATTDGTGHWAISVGLDEGENNLVFRIGDDRSTEKRLRVTYTPQAP